MEHKWRSYFILLETYGLAQKAIIASLALISVTRYYFSCSIFDQLEQRKLAQLRILPNLAFAQ